MQSNTALFMMQSNTALFMIVSIPPKYDTVRRINSILILSKDKSLFMKILTINLKQNRYFITNLCYNIALHVFIYKYMYLKAYTLLSQFHHEYCVNSLSVTSIVLKPDHYDSKEEYGINRSIHTLINSRDILKTLLTFF